MECHIQKHSTSEHCSVCVQAVPVLAPTCVLLAATLAKFSSSKQSGRYFITAPVPLGTLDSAALYFLVPLVQ